MKLTKQQLRQFIKEELSSDTAQPEKNYSLAPFQAGYNTTLWISFDGLKRAAAESGNPVNPEEIEGIVREAFGALVENIVVDDKGGGGYVDPSNSNYRAYLKFDDQFHYDEFLQGVGEYQDAGLDKAMERVNEEVEVYKSSLGQLELPLREATKLTKQQLRQIIKEEYSSGDHWRHGIPDAPKPEPESAEEREERERKEKAREMARIRRNQDDPGGRIGMEEGVGEEGLSPGFEDSLSDLMNNHLNTVIFNGGASKEDNETMQGVLRDILDGKVSRSLPEENMAAAQAAVDRVRTAVTELGDLINQWFFKRTDYFEEGLTKKSLRSLIDEVISENELIRETIAKQDCENSKGKDGDYVVKSKSGDTLGCHPSKESAKDQLAAIEINKEGRDPHAHPGQSCEEAHPDGPHDGKVEEGAGTYSGEQFDMEGPGPSSPTPEQRAQLAAYFDANPLTDDIVGPVDYKVYTPDGHLFGTFKINPDNELLDLEKLQRSFETLISDGFRVERVNLKE